MERVRGRRGGGAAAAATAVSAAAFALGAAVGTRRAVRARRRGGGGGLPAAAAAAPRGAEVDAAAAAEAEEAARRAADDALNCPVCIDELVVPRVAPCGHSLCTGCLVALAAHERRPCCPVCRKRIQGNVAELPVNFAAAAVVEARVAARGPGALAEHRAAEDAARAAVQCRPGAHAAVVAAAPGAGPAVLGQLRPAWNWFKWTAIIVTEFGAFLVSLKEVLEARPSRTRRYQRIV